MSVDSNCNPLGSGVLIGSGIDLKNLNRSILLTYNISTSIID